MYSENEKNTLSTQNLSIEDGWIVEDITLSDTFSHIKVAHCHSPHFTPRDNNEPISLLVIHNISLPPGKFGSNHINDFFQGCLNKADDPYFETIHEMKVSAHCLIRRDGELIQYVSFLNKAWHAGVSSYQGREKCNDYSIGIELEGTDELAYTEAQYKTLVVVSNMLQKYYPAIIHNIVGHCDVAPGRKTDPGNSFHWEYFFKLLDDVE